MSSSTKTAIATSAAPPPLPQFSQAVVHNGIVYCSGSIGVDPATAKIVEGSVHDRTRQALLNLAAVLDASGSSLNDVLKVNVFLTNMADFPIMNSAWDEVFKRENKPVCSKRKTFLWWEFLTLNDVRPGLVSRFTSFLLGPM